MSLAMFKKLGKVKGPSGGGKYFTDGKYKVILNKITAGESQSGEGEYVAVESTIAEVLVEYDNSNQVGERVSTLYMAKHGDVAISNLKGFIGALTGMDPNAEEGDEGYATGQQWAEAIEKASAGSGEALAGTELIADALTITTKKNKKPFTKVAWTAVE